MTQMSGPQEFHYRLPRRVRGWRPGFHPGSDVGAGQEFVAHQRLFDWPDPRRLDLRASLQNLHGDWLVRVHRQRASVTVYAIVDVSASMQFGARASKLHLAADFVEALGRSAGQIGDALGMLAFDAAERHDLFVPASLSRGIGTVMGGMLRDCAGAAGSVRGLQETALRLSGRSALVFIVSDFHWSLEGLGAVLDLLAQAYVVPIILWDRAEIRPPDANGLLAVRDAESGAQRTLWMRPGLRERWAAAVERRRDALERICQAREIRPFYLDGALDCDALSQYFLEASA